MLQKHRTHEDSAGSKADVELTVEEYTKLTDSMQRSFDGPVAKKPNIVVPKEKVPETPE